MPAQAESAVAGDANALVIANMPLVRIIAARLYRLRWGESVGFGDYLQSGMLGLVEASRRFDPGRGVQFSTFASWRITGAILNDLETATEQHQQIAARKRVIADRKASLQNPDGEGKLAEAPCSSAEDAFARIAEMAIGLAVGFMLEGSGMFISGDEATTQDGYRDLGTRRLNQSLWGAVDNLPASEREVIRGHYLEHLQFSEVADKLGLTRGRISQLHRQAIDRLKSAVAASGGEAFEA